MSKFKDNTMFILYVRNQELSMNFYKNTLGYDPMLHVPGMTEFRLNDCTSLGLMPEEGICRILDNAIPNPNKATGIPRCELYLFVPDPSIAYDNLIHAGGKGISIAQQRDWGDYVSYGADPDGHILAFAKR